ncbi:MAG: hypothetical protein KDA42_13065, partial [Planctomycetales bacterium]|nr:hypothetical protein [Planctomycetales bacterium]
IDPTNRDWQRLELPLEAFFAERGKSGAVTSVLKFESWGGAKDGRWHGPASAIYLLLSNANENVVRTISFRNIAIAPRPTAVAGAEVRATIPLDEIVEGVHDWRFSNGAEFKGASGSLTVLEDTPEPSQSCLQLRGDFTGGGAYVAAIRNMQEIAALETLALRLRMKTENVTSVGIQLVDSSGQTHQRRDYPIPATGDWRELTIAPTEIAGGEHWGGANDGTWHGPARQFVISLTNRSDSEGMRPSLLLDNVRAECLLPAFRQPAAWREDFATSSLDASWEATAGVSIDDQASDGSLRLSRSLEDVQLPCSVVGPTFPVVEGKWELRLASKADLHSPDNSYRGIVELECLDSRGQRVEMATVFEVFGQRDWQRVTKLVEIPVNAAAARFRMRLDKTYGHFWVDDLAAAYLAPRPQRDDRVERLLFATERLGNLLYPTDPRDVVITVEARKPLRSEQRFLQCVLRDYWGAEQMHARRLVLGEPARKNDRFVYETKLNLDMEQLDIGRYYELYAELSLGDGESFGNHTSLAILPEAVTRQYAPEEVPFTARNWDNRITEYVRLTDRLGVRVCGVWGGWKSTPPYQPEAPQLALVKELGMGWLTTTPAKFIEQGKYDYDEQALRQGVRNLIATFGDARPMIINLGNEPHGVGGVVRRNVEAYRVLYEEIKKVDPTIRVVATSVEPNEEYFQLGYGKWCDAFDFHIYEDSANVRRTIQEYRQLARKYGVEKPIWSTELGLNSQGLPRHRVAVELYKKFATFFAAGGENVSWFGLLYPDPQAKAFGDSGDAHNVFDCRYNRYCPRLDAVAYYHAVNSIAIKKFVAERQDENGTHTHLFRDRDGRCLQILWNDTQRLNIQLPLPDVTQADILHIDGSARTLYTRRGSILLTISDDPILVRYETGASELPAEWKAAPYRWIDPPSEISTAGNAVISLHAPLASAEQVKLIAPPHWGVVELPSRESERDRLDFQLTPPAETSVREVALTATIGDKTGRPFGEIQIRIPRANRP